MIMIDYLQLMNASGLKLGSREQEVSTISRSLKALAKELNIPIIALSQLNRSTESRNDKRPVLSDLRESGAIEQDADIVCFIHRPEYYTKASVDENGNDIQGLAEFIVAKHRSGAVDDVKLRFVSKYAKFENWEEGYEMVRKSFESSTVEGIHRQSRASTAPADASAFNFPPNPFAQPGPDISSSPDDDIPF